MSQVPLPRFAKVWQVWDTKRGKNVAADEVIDWRSAADHAPQCPLL